MPSDSSRRVACPDCGQEFSTRGLPAHRRQRHGAGVQAALPSPVPESLAHQLLSALQLLGGAVANIDERMRALEVLAGKKETPAEEGQRLERELTALLEEIGRLLRLAASARADITAGPLAEELARLRREQARLVYRIDELKKGSPSEERFLT
jgi:hypothetical protein